MKKPERKQRWSILALLAATPGLALAGPQGANVVAGAATIDHPSTHGTVINQASAKAIIDWQSFSIGANEYVQFNQPDSSSISLNRVVGSDPSTILGNLSANGQVFLVNPNGIFFGVGATLDVGGLVASTLDINNDDFLNGNYIFTNPENANSGSVVNAGVIQARESGYVVLMGSRVENSGNIETKFGQIALLAGGEVTLDINGDGLVSYSIDAAAATELAGVENSGALIADGGRVILAANVSDALVATAVNNTGLIQANGIEERNGEIYLTGNTDVYNSGVISASGESGGTISVQGKRVAQQGEVRADASVGDGGQISILADDVIALTNASLTTANAGVNADGGDVIVYTSGSAIFNYGAQIEAKGGAESGDGGFVEVSGLESVEINGFVDASAAEGVAGTFLIDPTDINIVSADTGDTDLGNPGAGDPRVFTNNGDDTNQILDTIIEGLLDGGTSVILQTASGGSADGDITVDAQIDKAAGGTATLTLQADNDIILNQDIVSTTGALNVVLEADNNIVFNTSADIRSNGGNVTITADADGGTSNETITMASDSVIDAGTGTISLSADGDIALGQLTTTNTVSVVTGNGEVTDANASTNNITASAVTITSDSGIGAGDALETAASSLDLSVLSTGDIEIDQTGGVDLAGIDTTDGNLSITASGAITTSADIVATDGDISITTTSDGDITLSNDVTATTSADDDDVSLTIAAGGIGILTQNAMTAILADAAGDDANATLNLSGGTVVLNGSSTVEIEDDTGGATEQSLLSITAGAGGLTTSGSLLANAVGDGNAQVTIVSGGSSTIGNTLTANVVDDGNANINIDSTTTTTVNAVILAEAGGPNSQGNATVTLDGDTAVDINNAVTAYADDDGNATVSIGGTGIVTIGAAVSSTVDGNGDASINIGTMGAEVASATIEAAGSLVLTEGSNGDSETLSIFSAGAINTSGGSLNANDGITLSGASVNVAGLTSSTGGVSVTADTTSATVGIVNADNDVIITAMTSINVADITVSGSDDDVTLTAGSTLSLGAINAANRIFLSAGALVSTGSNVYNANQINLSGTGMTGATYNIDTDTADLRLTGGIANAMVDNTANSMTPAAVTFSGSGFGTLDIDTNVNTNVSGTLSATGTVDINSGSGDLDIANMLTADNGITFTSAGALTTAGLNASNANASINLMGASIAAGDLITDAMTGTVLLDAASSSAGAVTTNTFTVQNGGGNATDLTLSGTLTTPITNISITGALDLQAVSSTGAVTLDASSISSGDISGTTVSLDAATINVAAVTTTAGLSVLNADDFTAIGTINNGGLALLVITTDSIDTQAITNTASVVLTSDVVSSGNLTAASGNVVVTANNGSADTGNVIANSGSVNVGATNGATTITGNISAGTGITLSGAGVTATASGNLTTAAGNISVNVPVGDANGISLGNLSATSGTVTIDADMGDATVGNVNAVSGTISGEDVAIGSVGGNIGVMASNLTLDGTYTNGTFSATNTLTLDTTGIINNSNVTLTGTNVNVDGTINAMDTGAEQNASVTISATNNISMSGTVMVSSQSGNAIFTATADSDGMGGGDFTQTAAGAVTVTADNTPLGSPFPESGLGNANITIAGASVQQSGSLTSNVSNGVSAVSIPISGFPSIYIQTGSVANQSTVTLTSTTGNVETNTITSNYSADSVFNGITGSESVSINSAAGVTVGGIIQTSNTLSTESVSIMAAGNVDGAGSISSDSVSITTTGDIGNIADSLNIDAGSVLISGALSNAWLGLDRATSTLTLGSGIANTLDITSVGNLNLAGTLTANDIVLDVAGNASDGGNVLTASSVSLNGSGNYGTIATRFDINAADINIDEAVSTVALNSSAATTNLNFINTGHGDIDVSGSSDLSIIGASAISANTVTINTSGSLDVQQALTTTNPLVLTANGITTGSNVLTASTVTLNGTGTSSVDVVTDTSAVNLGAGIGNATVDTTAQAVTALNLTSTNYGDLTVTSAAVSINGGNVNTGNIDIDATDDITINATLNATAAMGVTTVTLDTSAQLINNGAVAANDVTGSSSIVIGATTAIAGMSGAGQYQSDTVSITGTNAATLTAITNAATLNINGGANLNIDNNAFAGSTTFNYGSTNYTSLDLRFGGTTTLVGGDITTTGLTSINGQAGLNLNQGYIAPMINLTAGGQVNVMGLLDAATINFAGNGAASFGSSGSKIMTNANLVDLGTGISNVFINNEMNVGNATLNFSGTNYGVVDFDFGGTSSQVGTATTSTVQGNDFLASALAISANGNIVVTAGFDVNGGTVPGVQGDTLLTSAVASVGGLINAGGSTDPNASFIATDSLTLNINNLKQSNQYLLIKADDITLTGTSNAANLLVQLTPFTTTQASGVDSTLSFNQSTQGTADFNFTFDGQFAPFTGTTIALGEQGFGGNISIGNIDAGSKNLLFLSGGTVTGINNILGTGLLGTADETGGFFIVRPIITTVTLDQLGIFGFRLGARVSTIELNNDFDATSESEGSNNDLELEDGGVNDGSETECS